MNSLQISLQLILPVILAFISTKIITSIFNNDRLGSRVYLIFLRSMVVVILWIIAGYITMAGIPGFSRSWETVIAGSGVAAAIIGLAAQSSLSNVFSGIAVTATAHRPFDIGDRVQIGTAEPGYVTDITLRHVQIQTFLNQVIYIPNNVVGSSVIINYTKQDGSSYPVEIDVAYEADLKKAMEIMGDIINNHPKHYGNKSLILCKEAGASGIHLKGTMTTQSFADITPACSEVMFELIRRFKEEGIEIPYTKIVTIEGK